MNNRKRKIASLHTYNRPLLSPPYLSKPQALSLLLQQPSLKSVPNNKGIGIQAVVEGKPEAQQQGHSRTTSPSSALGCCWAEGRSSEFLSKGKE
jgi:hypothetical protein